MEQGLMDGMGWMRGMGWIEDGWDGNRCELAHGWFRFTATDCGRMGMGWRRVVWIWRDERNGRGGNTYSVEV